MTNSGQPYATSCLHSRGGDETTKMKRLVSNERGSVLRTSIKVTGVACFERVVGYLVSRTFLEMYVRRRVARELFQFR